MTIPTLICNFDHADATKYLDQMKAAGFPDGSIAEVPIEAFYEARNFKALTKLEKVYKIAVYNSAWHTPKEFIPGQYGGMIWDAMEMTLTQHQWTDIIAWQNPSNGITKYWQEPGDYEWWVETFIAMTAHIRANWSPVYWLFDHLIRRENHPELYEFQVACVEYFNKRIMDCYVNGQASKLFALPEHIGSMIEAMGVHWSDTDELQEIITLIGEHGSERNLILDLYRVPHLMWLAMALANLGQEYIMPGRMRSGGFYVDGPNYAPTTLAAEWPEYFGG